MELGGWGAWFAKRANSKKTPPGWYIKAVLAALTVFHETKNPAF